MTLNELIDQMVKLAAEEHFDGHAPVLVWNSSYGETKPLRPEDVTVDDGGAVRIEA